MKCTEIEAKLCDYTDGTLSVSERSAVEQHLLSCPLCAELARDAAAAVAFIGRIAEVEPPPALVTKILHQIPAKPTVAQKAKSSIFGLFGRWIQPVMQPRMVMGMAMTILSFAMLGRFAGIEVRQLKPSDLEPVKVWAGVEDRAHRSWQRAVKYYESLRFVYEIQSRLRELTANEEGTDPSKQPAQPGAQSPARGAQTAGENTQ